MEDKTIFNANQQPPQGESVTPPVVPPVAPQPVPENSYSEYPYDYPSDSFFSRIPFFVKLLVGLLILALIGLGIFLGVRSLLSPQQSGEVTLTYWGLWEGENVMKPIIEEFEKEHPNIKVEYQKQDIKQYLNRLDTRIPAGTGPDIFRYHNTWLPMTSSYLSPLPSSVMTGDEFKSTYYPVMSEDLVKNGAIYGIPIGIDTVSLFVNDEIFQAAGATVPKTWDEFINTARSLTVKDETGQIKTSGAAFGTYDNVNHAPDVISVLLSQNGTDILDIQSTAKNTVDALNFYTLLAKGDDSVWDTALDNSLTAFANGSVAMYFGYSWDIFAIKAMNPNLQFSIYPVPHLPNRDMTIASYWVDGVSSKSPHQKEAMEFMKFMSEKETQQKLFTQASKTREFGFPYARVDLAESLKDNPLLYPFVQQAPTAVSSYFVSDTYDDKLNSGLNGYLGNAVRSMLGNTSGETAVDTLIQGVNQKLQEYGVN